MKRVIIFTGGIETQGFFSLEIARTLKALGHPVFVFDLEYEEKALLRLLRYMDKGNTVLIAFNFHGFSGEEIFIREDGTLFWDEFSVPCINIVVDHPLYSPKFLANLPRHSTHLNIDTHHRDYMKRFYPGLDADGMLYLAGTALDDEGMPIKYVRGLTEEESAQGGRSGAMDNNTGSNKAEPNNVAGVCAFNNAAVNKAADCAAASDRVYSEEPSLAERMAISPESERPYDIVFAGNYTPPSEFVQYITRLDDDYTTFYYGIIHELLDDPTKTLEEVAEKHIRKEIPGVTEAELKETFPNMTFIDLYIRFYERGQAVKTLAEAGFKVHVFGEGWERLKCSRSENIIRHGSVLSLDVLRAQAKAKISLNVMPWFKEGIHDRVLNSCANGAVCLTDSSIYTRKVLEDKKDVYYYDLLEMEALPDLAAELLGDEAKRLEVAYSGRKKTLKEHLWTDRALKLHKLIEGI